MFSKIWWHCMWSVCVESTKGDSWAVNSCSWAVSLFCASTAFGLVALWSVTGLIAQINGMFSFWPWSKQACVCAAYIIWANSDPASYCYIQKSFRSQQSFNQLLPRCFWWLCSDAQGHRSQLAKVLIHSLSKSIFTGFCGISIRVFRLKSLSLGASNWVSYSKVFCTYDSYNSLHSHIFQRVQRPGVFRV